MRVSIKRRYFHKYIPKRCRKERTEVRETEFSVSIREVKAEDAPVAFIVRTIGELPSVVRSYKGKLYRNNFDYRILPDRKHGIADLDYVIRTRFKGHDSCASDSEEEAKAKARKNAKEYLIVDGVMYCHTGEPYYSTTEFGLGHNHGGTGLFVDYVPTVGMTPKYMNTTACPATMRDLAIREGLITAYRRGDDKSYDGIREGVQGYIQVFMPEACRFKFNLDRLPSRRRPLTSEEESDINAIGGALPWRFRQEHVDGYFDKEEYQRAEDYAVGAAPKAG